MYIQNSSSLDAVKLQSSIDLYRKEIHSTRQNRKNVMESEHTLLKKILRYIITC